jgi:hypothetical protein
LFHDKVIKILQQDTIKTMYEIRFYRGNYRWRQKQANRDDCAAYIEHHFNASTHQTANYTLVITSYLASETSKNWGRWYANRINQELRIPLGGKEGILSGGYNGRGNGNLKHTVMPAILLEPLFVSNPQHAEILHSEEGQDKLALILAESIIAFFPDSSKIGFSVGHKYKTSRPNDRGAMVYGGGTEADFAEIVLEKAKNLLEDYNPEAKNTIGREEIDDYPDNDIRIIKDGKEIWLHTDIDEDDEIKWDQANRILYITTN